jgi:four helix bundle protein
MRRAAVSIAANIAEAFGRWSPRDRARSLEIAKSSAEEVMDYLILSVDLSSGMRLSRLGLMGLCAMLYRARQSVLGGSWG